MKNIADGYATIKIGADLYELAPSFCNMAKLGDPVEIIELFKAMVSPTSYIHAFCMACDILEACGLPSELLGHIKHSERQGKMMIVQGIIPYKNVYVLAMHCLKHGICGTTKQVEDANSKRKQDPIEEFDPYVYITSAMESLGMSFADAEQLTMTRYIKLLGAKIKTSEQLRKKPEPTKAESSDAMSKYEKLRQQADAAAVAKRNKG